MAPLNELEQLLAKPRFGPQDYPEMFRLLRETELCFLLPYHPEMEGATIGLENGDQLPPFVVWSSPKDGPRIPIFSSIERAQEACEKTGSRENQYVIADMPGRQLFEILSCQPDGIAINPATGGPSIMMDIEGIKQLGGRNADEDVGEKKTGQVQLLTPADYPTKLVQSLFQYLRGCPGVRAAWLARDLAPAGPGTGYIVMVLGAGDQKKVQDDIIIVAGSAIAKGESVHTAFFDGTNAAALATAEKFTPFYAAPDYRAADPLGPG